MVLDQGCTSTCPHPPLLFKKKQQTNKTLFTNLFSSVMSSAVQGMPRVIRDNELTTGLTKASPVVIPDKMPMTTLNLDLD